MLDIQGKIKDTLSSKMYGWVNYKSEKRQNQNQAKQEQVRRTSDYSEYKQKTRIPYLEKNPLDFEPVWLVALFMGSFDQFYTYTKLKC